jgi:hypothetical protein
MCGEPSPPGGATVPVTDVSSAALQTLFLQFPIVPMQNRGFHNRHRSGLAVVECAVALPVLLLIIICTIDICNFIFLKQTLTVAAYEGVRVAIVPESTLENVEVQIENVLQDRGVIPSSISVTPSNFDHALPGTFVQVSVSANSGDNSLIGLLGQRVINAKLQMMKEF